MHRGKGSNIEPGVAGTSLRLLHFQMEPVALLSALTG